MASYRRSLLAVFSLALLAATPLRAQQPAAPAPPAVNAADYARAERFLAANVTPLVVGGSVVATWLPDDRFWYRNSTAEGAEFVLVTPSARSRRPAFDHARVAAALSAATGSTYDGRNLPFQVMALSPDGRTISFDLDKQRWACDTSGARCSAIGPATGGEAEVRPGMRPGRARSSAVTSPDGKSAAFVRDWNLWVRDLASGRERPLTTDGVKDFGYATDNAGWVHSDRAIVLWSPDSKKIATFQQDERSVGEMYLVETRVGHPVLQAWKYPLPGDPVVAMLHRVIIDADSGRVTRLQMPPDFHRGTIGDNFNRNDWQWSPDASRLAFASTPRDHKQAILRVADAASGAVRTVFDESAATHFESIAGWRVLWETNEVIWSSERNGWSNLYLYDLASGALKNAITTGEGPVSDIEKVDAKTRSLWFTATDREKGQDPYFRHLYRVGLDGRNLVSITPDLGDHTTQLSPSGKYVIDTYSTCVAPPIAVLRDLDGKVVMPLEKADISKLLAAGWKPPIPISVKARDGKTDLYGMMFVPTRLEAGRKYPIINNAYPGPAGGSVGSRSFAAARGDKQALAELGFVVVSIDGMGTEGRSKAFHDIYYGAMGRDNTLPDQVAGMKELAQRYPYIDIDRAAIWGHSGGGFIAADAMFRYPDFFKVGISESGNHDQRSYEDDWGERYQGLLVRDGGGSDNYEPEANQAVAKNLKGHLLLAHGTMDDNVPPYNTLLVVDALIKANKDFDLLMLPNQAHGYGRMSSYMMRRRWDYFVKWLLGVDPPKEYLMASPPAGR